MTNETIEDILREMRGDREFRGAEFRALADRIEAAHKRLVSRKGNIFDRSSAAECEHLKMLINGIVRPHEVDVSLDKVGNIVNDLIATKNAIYYWLRVFEDRSKDRDKIRNALREVLGALECDPEYSNGNYLVMDCDNYKSEWDELAKSKEAAK